jgi:hypothetical protein
MVMLQTRQRLLALIALSSSFVLIGSAHSQVLSQKSPTPTTDVPQVPDPLQVPSGQSLILKTYAKGNQIYVCRPTADTPNTFAWTLLAPEAELLSAPQKSRKLGKHYGGPTWEANDGSKIFGGVKARVDSPQADAIPWLLLEVKTRQGQGVFSSVNWIQRLNTSGGKAPTEGCDATQQNREARVPYTTDYYFYGSK